MGAPDYTQLYALGQIADGLFAANAAGRAKFGDGFVTGSLLADAAVKFASFKKAVGTYDGDGTAAGPEVALGARAWLLLVYGAGNGNVIGLFVDFVGDGSVQRGIAGADSGGFTSRGTDNIELTANGFIPKNAGQFNASTTYRYLALLM
jgi:hypothetical protein